MKALNRPEKTVTGNHKPHKITPKILPRDMWRYHLPVLGMKPAQDEQVVMWTDGAVHYSGYDADTNDGLRSGSLSGRVDMRSNFCRYALLSDWLAAGNEMPA